MKEDRSKTPGKRYAVVHGHFYQPPRENPWTGEIGLQRSAAPFHDWNERIAAECYRPNAFARILNPQGDLFDVVNNFEYINFNIGPTLMQWIKKQAPEIYRKILEADRKSMDRNGGHGNAIAQVFNHMIMPLATPEERHIQILWGIEDFRSHFGREPEGIWLSETAVDEGTLKSLLCFDIKYVILSPFQAEKVRPAGSKSWTGVAGGRIDTTKAYRINRRGKHLNVVFYHHGISSGISFGDLLASAQKLLDTFTMAVVGRLPDALVTACVDGESFGHHKKFGEMGLAYFLKYLAPQAGFEVINLSRYLELHPPEDEVVLAQGEKKEGTSWSCAHGVSRWIRDCGCSTGGEPSWNQRWRTPLREAFNFLRGEIQKLVKKEVSPLVKDAAAAYQKYFSFIWEKTPERREAYLAEIQCGSCSAGDKKKILALFEAAYLSQLTFTSCAWFFADISGLEARQNIQYALRALEWIKPYAPEGLEEEFLSILEKGMSNIPQSGDGRAVYLDAKKNDRIDKRRAAANHVVDSLLLADHQSREKTYPNFDLHIGSVEMHDEASPPVYKGRVKRIDHVNGEEEHYSFYLVVPKMWEIRCYILNQEAADHPPDFNLMESALREAGGEGYYGLNDLFPETGRKMISLALEKQLEEANRFCRHFYEDNLDLIASFIDSGAHVPGILHSICAHNLTSRVIQHIEEGERQDFSQARDKVLEDYRVCERLGIRIHAGRVAEVLQNILNKQFKRPLEEWRAREVDQVIRILDLMEEFKVMFDLSSYQEQIFFQVHRKDSEKPEHPADPIRKLAGRFHVSF